MMKGIKIMGVVPVFLFLYFFSGTKDWGQPRCPLISYEKRNS